MKIWRSCGNWLLLGFLLACGSPKCLAQGGPPIILIQPASQTVNQGQNATFFVSAQSQTTMTYQWRHGGGDISGATASTYTIVGVTTNQAGAFSVAIDNAAGTTWQRQSQP